MISTSVLNSLLLLGFVASYALISWRRKAKFLPPGPKGYPLIGNVYDVPHEYPWLTYAEWAKTYGDVVSTTVFGTTTIILNSLKATTELLDKRSSNYSDRPTLIMADELMEWGWDFAHMPYTDRWRRHRRMFHQYFQPRNLPSFYTVQKKTAVHLLGQLSQTPDQFSAHVKQFVASVVLNAAYGYSVKTENDFYIHLVQRAIAPLLLVVHAGKYVVEYLHWLKHVPLWVPGANFKRKASVWAEDARRLRDLPFDGVKKSMAEGVVEQCFVSENLQNIKSEDAKVLKEEEEIIKNCAGIIYLAGSDTSSSAILSWMLAMAHNPDVLKKAQLEIDSVLGMSRLPDFSDRASLPYLEAMVLETLRWHAIVPLSLPHRAVADDEYEGFKIPAGSVIVPNVWAILHDEEIYPDPLQFKPERFLEENGDRAQADPTVIGTFGFGRRTCPGRHIALNSIWIAVASILSSYNISKATDTDGNVIEPAVDFTDGLVSHPKAFKLHITPRSEAAVKLIESAKIENSFD